MPVEDKQDQREQRKKSEPRAAKAARGEQAPVSEDPDTTLTPGGGRSCHDRNPALTLRRSAARDDGSPQAIHFARIGTHCEQWQRQAVYWIACFHAQMAGRNRGVQDEDNQR